MTASHEPDRPPTIVLQFVRCDSGTAAVNRTCNAVGAIVRPTGLHDRASRRHNLEIVPLIPVPGPTEPELVLSYEDQRAWLTGSRSDIRVSVGVTNVGKRPALGAEIHVPSFSWCPRGGNPESNASGAWSLALADKTEKMHWTPQKFAPGQRRFAWVAQIDKYSLRFMGGPTSASVETFEDEGILKVHAVVSWTDPAEPAAPHRDDYEIEIQWLKGPPEPGSTFKVKLSPVGV